MKHLNRSNLHRATPAELFELIKLGHPKEHGINVTRNDLILEWEKRGESVMHEIGYSTDRNATIQNRHTGDVSTIGDELDFNWWWSIAEHWTPCTKPVRNYQPMQLSLF